jgi:hypothetical protein
MLKINIGTGMSSRHLCEVHGFMLLFFLFLVGMCVVRDLVLQERPLASILRILMSLYVSLSNLNFHVRTL